MIQNKITSLGVIIATTGRADIVADTVRSIARLKSIPECIIVVGAAAGDLPNIKEAMPFDLDLFVATAKGSSLQRNWGIKRLKDTIRYVSFLDDDMELHPDYFLEVYNVFESDTKIVGFSGAVLANGNIDRINARDLLDHHVIHPSMPCFGFYPKKWPGFYGCNMNIRKDSLKMEQFDERLPLYSLGEDCEMGFRLSRQGYVGGSARCPAVHLAVKSGRISEIGVGYAQIINILYFANKGIGYPKSKAYWESLIKLPLVNLVCFLIPKLEKRRNIDRRGRVIGNLYAVRDVVVGKNDPMRLLKILKN
jgi:GT2 family glycosyltransferase